MRQIEVLDCTLRDGGYINDFSFTNKGIKKIIQQLTESNIEVIECGFLEDGEYDPECSVYDTAERITPFIPKNRNHTLYVAMACFGEFSLKNLSDFDGSSIDGIRVSFHYNEVEGALNFCKQIISKGYKLFVQPIGTTSYTDEMLIHLIESVNQLSPYAFYLVDTLGLMQQADLSKYFHLIDSHLSKSVKMGFHSHNNLQLSFSNCQYLVNSDSDRSMILDASVNGMGRGAGNLNTELITNYINAQLGRKYEIVPLLEIVDEFIGKIKKNHEWGYSVPYYLAAINGCHPNYASYLSKKQTLNVQSIAKILRMIEPEKRSLFSQALAEQKYREFQSHEIDDSACINLLRNKIRGRNVMLIAPGPSLKLYQRQIIECATEHECITISVSFVPEFMDCDYTFLCNLKRLHTTFNPTHKPVNLICTSNISVTNETALIVNYSSLLNEIDIIIDNTSIMLLNLLCRLSPSIVFLAGLDGYSANKANYYLNRLELPTEVNQIEALNSAMTTRIHELKRHLDLHFITPSEYE